MGAISQFLLSNRTGESLAVNSLGQLSSLFLSRADTQSGFQRLQLAIELLRIDKKAMALALQRERRFMDMFVADLLARNIRYEEDLVDQLFNSSEKRLARILLLLAHFGQENPLKPHSTRSVKKPLTR